MNNIKKRLMQLEYLNEVCIHTPSLLIDTKCGIIEDLNLLRPIYTDTSAYGHFGRENPDFSWEKTGQL